MKNAGYWANRLLFAPTTISVTYSYYRVTLVTNKADKNDKIKQISVGMKQYFHSRCSSR